MFGPNGSSAIINYLLDSGNDINLLKKEEARRIGIDPETIGTPFSVMGVSAGQIRPRLTRLMMQIGNLRPRVFRVGIGDVPENLTGFEDMSQYYIVTIVGRDSVIIEEKGMKPSNLPRRMFSTESARFLRTTKL